MRKLIYLSIALFIEASAPSDSCLDTGACNLSCAKKLDRYQKKKFPNYKFNFGHGAGKKRKQPIKETWDPILESIPRCNGLPDGQLLSISFLVVLDKSWVDFYYQHAKNFATQGYHSLLSSPHLLFDRVSYLYEKQFGVRIEIGHVEVFPNLYNNCAGVKTSALAQQTKSMLRSHGTIRDVSKVRGGIVRLGTNDHNGKYCNSSAPIRGACKRASRIGQLSFMTVQEKPFLPNGKLRHRAPFSLAYELAHMFGMCVGRADCLHKHSENNFGDIMSWEGGPFKKATGRFHMWKFNTKCSSAYHDLLCKRVKVLNSNCAVRVSAGRDNRGVISTHRQAGARGKRDIIATHYGFF